MLYHAGFFTFRMFSRILEAFGYLSETLIITLPEEDTKLSTLRQLLEEGEASEFVEYSLSDLIEELDSESQ